LDIYWHIAEPGDCYLGRILVGLDPNDASFGTLPPHFVMTDPMSNPYVNEAMQLMYGPILRKWSNHEVDPMGLLLRCLPSVVYNSEFLKEWARNIPAHSFGTIPLLNNESLLQELKKLVTLEPTDSMRVATGIPPHINNAILMKEILVYQHVGRSPNVDRKSDSCSVGSVRGEGNGKWSDYHGTNEKDLC
jgi:hypothetical protein